WAAYNRTGRTFPDGMWTQVSDALEKLEHDAGLGFGDPKRPLLVSVRSGARVSMPGMMETVLNLGLNDETVEGLAAWTRNERCARCSTPGTARRPSSTGGSTTSQPTGVPP